MTFKPVITDRQRQSQRKSLINAKKILELAILEIRTATPGEVSQNIDTVLEILHGANKFLKTREG